MPTERGEAIGKPGRAEPQRPHRGAITATADPVPWPPLWLLLGRLAQWLPASRDVDAYFLGPKPFMALVKRQLEALGVPQAQTHFEFFGPAAALN